MAGSVKTVAGLMAEGAGGAATFADMQAVGERYAIAVTPEMLALMDLADADDPIARQFIPDLRELESLPEERADPIGDHAHSPVEGLVHRYRDRVLLKAVHVCPVYCRFCFRREMVGPKGDGMLSAEALVAAFDYIRAHQEIWEVIITGGDPLILSPRRLADLLAPLQTIDHVKIVRFHTRVPVVDPSRITLELADALKAGGKTPYVALHANHPRELTDAAKAACGILSDNGIAMVSQTVLLKGVNDDADVLAALMRGFVAMRVQPYYLHHPDLAPGTGHFRMTIAEGQAIVAALRAQTSGLCQPRYMLDIPGGFGKVEISPASLVTDSGGKVHVRNRQGVMHAYPFI